MRDFRYSMRGLRQNPGFTLTVVAMLALGIGANTTIFSVVRAVMLKPLPYKEPGRLVRLWESSPERGSLEFQVSAPNFRDWQSRQSVFEELAALELATFNLTGTGEPERIAAASITANLIPALGVMPAIGRNFLPEEETPGHNRVVILSNSLWQRQFGGDPSMPGKAIQLNGRSYTVVGVMPVDFQIGGSRELWVPLVLDPATEPWRADRTNHNLAVFGQLRPGVTVDQASAEMMVVAERLEQQYPGSNTGWGVRVRTFYDWLVPEQVRRSISVLFVAVALVLLIACANVANLLLARATRRRQEMAVRSALGASRSRLVRQLLIESLLLAVLGGLAGLLLTIWATGAGGQWSVAGGQGAVVGGQWPVAGGARVDSLVLSFAMAVSVATGLIFGLAPAWRASRVDLNLRLNETGRSDTGGAGRRLRSALVVGEVALALALLVTAGLMMRSFVRLQAVPLGFVPDHVLTMQISLPESKYSGREARVNFFDELLERLRTVPGVVDAAATTHPPVSTANWAMEISVEGLPPAPDKSASSADARAVTPDYFRTMEIPLLQGREFIKGDLGDKLIVSATFARRYWPGQDPIGKRLRPGTSNPVGTVVGVVGDVRDNNLQEEPHPTFYFPYAYIGMQGLVVAVRTGAHPETRAAQADGQPQTRETAPVDAQPETQSGVRNAARPETPARVRAAVPPETLATALRAQVQAIDSDQPVYNIRTMDQIVSVASAQPRFQTTLLGLFSIIALVLATVGIYSVMAYVVRQRRSEIGVRMALGADAADILRMVVGQGMRQVLLGVALGLIGCLWVTRLMKGLIFDVSVTDPLTFITVALLLVAVAFIACYVPAWRATRLNPSISLREQ